MIPRFYLALLACIPFFTANLWAENREPKTTPSPLTAFLAKSGIAGGADQAAGAAEHRFLQQSDLPASFVYGGTSSRELLKTWMREARPPVQQADRTVYETTWREPGGGLAATWKATVFRDLPAAEFQWAFINEGKTSAKPLTQVLALDLKFSLHPQSIEVIQSTGGLDSNIYDNRRGPGFAVSHRRSPFGEPITLSGRDGLSSDKDLPFFLLHCNMPPEQGIFVGIGWSGQWEARIDLPSPKSNKEPTVPMSVTAEMPGMNLALPPGERIVSPSILLGAYSGDWTKGSNTLRQALYQKYVPLLSGSKPLPPVSWNSWATFTNKISEEILKTQADFAAEAGIEYFCIDAGWFEGGFDPGVGNWTIDKAKFPNGLAPIGKYVAQKGMKLGLWFEPERACGGTRVRTEHPDWVAEQGAIVNFGKPEVREWMFQMMKHYIDEVGVKWIRWDFNTRPLEAWKRWDATDQQGLSQIRCIMGLYEVLDRLMAAYPDLLIEGCASGGRRMDLETVRRSHTFWKADSWGPVPLLRFHETGGNVFLPGGLINTNLAFNHSPWDLYSTFGGPLGFCCDWTKLTPEQRQQARQIVDQYKPIRELLNCDYYPLFPQHRDETGWTGWQFDAPERGEGFVFVTQESRSPYTSALVSLKGLDPQATYTLTWVNDPSKEPVNVNGGQLLKGWKLEAPNQAVIRYQKKP